MLGPSPDWIVGVSALEMCQINCTWIDNKVCTWMYDKVCTWIYEKEYWLKCPALPVEF